jgi:hypothetical protein
MGLLAELFTAFARDDELPYSVEQRIGADAGSNGDGRARERPAHQTTLGEGS